MRKRANNGRSKKNRGSTQNKRCDNCFAMVPKDKAIAQYKIKNLIDVAAHDDVKQATVYDVFEIPKIPYKLYYCVSCAVHLKIVRVRSRWNRKIRNTQRVF